VILRRNLWRVLCAAGLSAAVCTLFPSYSNATDYSQALRLAVDRWLADQKPSGLLPYDFDFLADKESEPNSISTANLVRQAGTAAVLADYYELTKDRRAEPALRKYLEALRRYSIPIGKKRMQSLVEQTHLLSLSFGRHKMWKMLDHFGLLFETAGPGKVLSPDGTYGNAHTGGVALALLTEVLYSRASGDDRFADLRKAWLEALLMLRIPGRGFRQLPTSIDETPYYDGEGWLALAHYHRAFPADHHAAETLESLDEGLLDFYGREFKRDFFHWGSMAAAARYKDTHDQRFLEFLKVQLTAFLDKMRNNPKADDNNCFMLEGVLDALDALEKSGNGHSHLAKQARAWAEVEMKKTIGLQLQPGQKGMKLGGEGRLIAPRMQEFAGSFLDGVYGPRTRVDLSSHCVSAMVKLHRQGS
jgi:hypothetical protein